MASGKASGYGKGSNPPVGPQRARAAQEEKQGMTPEMLFETIIDFLKRRGLPAVFLGLLLGGSLAFAAYSLLPVTYTAVASITIRSPRDTLAERFKQTQIDLITSPRVVNAALNDPKAKMLPFVQNSNQPALELPSRVKFVTDLNSEMVDVTMTGEDPYEVQTLVNALVEAYLEQTQELTNVHAANEEKLYAKGLAEVNEQIDSLRRLQADRAGDAGQTDPNSVKVALDAVRAELADKKKQREQAELRKISLEADLKRLKTTTPTLSIEQEQSLMSLKRSETREREAGLEIMAQKAEAIRAASTLGERDPEYIKYKKFVDDQRKLLDSETEGLRQKVLERLLEQHRAQIARTTTDIEAIEATIRSLDEDRLELEKREKKLQKLALEIDQYQQKIVTLQKEQQKIAEALKEISFARDSKYISLVGLAELPKIPSSSRKRLLAIAGGGVGGFGMVVLLFWFFDFRRKLVSRPDHLHHLLTLPVLGVLPTIPRGIRLPTDEDFAQSSRTQRQWAAMHEAINALRITLTFAPDRHEDGLNSLMITSPRDGEGKSTLTAHLAVSLARTGVRVVIIEADMHRPTQYETFRIERVPGLSDVLQQKMDVSEAVRETNFPGLDILTAGTPVEDMTSLLVREKIEPVFEYLRNHYDTVLVDAPPVLPVYDAMLFGRQVDQTLLCAMCNHSQIYTIEQAQRRLESIGIPIMGVVVAAAPSPPKYYDSYYRADGYRGYAHAVVPTQNKPAAEPNASSPAPSTNGASKSKAKV